MKDFRDLNVWQNGMQLFDDVVKDVECFPRSEIAKVITNQILRSVSSITANIAEGYGRRKGKEFEHYLYIARGSANETMDWYEKIKRLGFLSEEKYRERQRACETIRAMLSAMITNIEQK